MVTKVMEAAELLAEQGKEVEVIDLFRIKPLPEDLIASLVGKKILTVENHNQIGGLGSAICEALSREKNTPVTRMGVNESFGQVGKSDYLLDVYDLSTKHIVETVISL